MLQALTTKCSSILQCDLAAHLQLHGDKQLGKSCLGTCDRHAQSRLMRPQVTVKDSPAAWWQHAGYAALQECRLISRRQFPFSGMAGRRTSRQLYQVRHISASEQRQIHIKLHGNMPPRCGASGLYAGWHAVGCSAKLLNTWQAYKRRRGGALSAENSRRYILSAAPQPSQSAAGLVIGAKGA